MSILYEEELKKNLVEYRKVLDQIDELNDKKEKMRAQLKQWLALNNITEYSIEDVEGQAWKINFNHNTRRSVADWTELKIKLGSEFDHFVKINESTSFLVKKIKRVKD